MCPISRGAASRLLLIPFTVAAVSTAPAQNPGATIADLPPATLALTDLTDLRAVAGNWKIVGHVATEHESSPALVTSPGTGILVNTASGAPMSTKWEHGDLDLSFDVMLPKGSTPMLLLMGRYGLQLSDSWAPGAPAVATIGAVAPPWESARGPSHAGFEGTPPRQNAGRAPGLWQHVDIAFRAPRFSAGKKVANARFAKVSVNGVVVQENVQVTGPTRGAASGDERSSGPLVVEGAHGPIALRNVRYKSYRGAVTLADLHYRVYEGDAMDASYAASHAPVRQGAVAAISPDLPVPQDKFAVAYDGTMTAPTAGTYRFELSLGWIGNDATTRGASIGGGTLSVDGTPVVAHTGGERRRTGDVELSAGSHAIAVSYYKNRPQFNRRDVAITVEGPGVERQSLTDDSGARGDGNAPINPIMIDAQSQSEPVLVRSFVRHRDTKRVLAMSVGDPRGVHFTYDLGQGSLLYVWRGPYLEMTQMWHERGEDQTSEPLGSSVTLTGSPSVSHLTSAAAPWPDSLDDREFHRDGYQLDKTGHPTFLYRVHGVSVEDAVRADLDGLTLHREIRMHAPPGVPQTDGLYVQLAQAGQIERQRDGSYVVGDRAYYLKLPANGSRPVLRHTNGMDELLMPVQFSRGEASVSYSIVW
ncbi:hypothetical protein BH11GEM2_BH11GEM2_05880 [soil metagenome]